MSEIKGIYAAGLSVLDENLALDVKNTIKHAENVIDLGCHGVVFFGSTGQSQLISLSEKIQLINELPNSRYKNKFIIGTGLNSLIDTIIDSVNERITRTEPAITTSIATTAAPTHRAICGDGNLGSGESCDDGNTVRGDGCDERCAIEDNTPTIETFYVYGTTNHHLHGIYHKTTDTSNIGNPGTSNVGSNVYIKEGGSIIVYYKSGEGWNFCNAINGVFNGVCYAHLNRRGNVGGSENNPGSMGQSTVILVWDTNDSDVHITYDIADIL